MVEQRSYGIGTSNKTIAVYIAELKANGVKIVADVRRLPRSRWFPHFNRDAFTQALAAEGISYVWLGETLGNPKDDQGERTLEGFRDHHMKTVDYEKGMSALMALVASGQGRVAVTCSEGDEAACHRQFILADLRQRLITE